MPGPRYICARNVYICINNIHVYTTHLHFHIYYTGTTTTPTTTTTPSAAFSLSSSGTPKTHPCPCTVASPAAPSQNLLGQKYTRVSIYTYILCTYYLYVYTVYNILPTYNYIYLRSRTAPFPPPQRVYIINNVKVSPFDGVRAWSNACRVRLGSTDRRVRRGQASLINRWEIQSIRTPRRSISYNVFFCEWRLYAGRGFGIIAIGVCSIIVSKSLPGM